MNIDDALASGVDRVQSALDNRQMVKIYSHVDADGLAAGAILAKTLTRAHIPHQIRVLRQLEAVFIDQIAQEYARSPFLCIFSDFGSGHGRPHLRGRLGDGVASQIDRRILHSGSSYE